MGDKDAVAETQRGDFGSAEACLKLPELLQKKRPFWDVFHWGSMAAQPEIQTKLLQEKDQDSSAPPVRKKRCFRMSTEEDLDTSEGSDAPTSPELLSTSHAKLKSRDDISPTLTSTPKKIIPLELGARFAGTWASKVAGQKTRFSSR